MKYYDIGTWLHQKNSAYENTYALIIGYTKHRKIEAISIQDFRPIAVKTTLTNWYPEPVVIDSQSVPNKLKQKVQTKRGKLNK